MIYIYITASRDPSADPHSHRVEECLHFGVIKMKGNNLSKGIRGQDKTLANSLGFCLPCG